MNELFRTLPIKLIALVLTTGLGSMAAHAVNIPSNGTGWSSLKLDGPVKSLMNREKLPGMTIAVVEDDRLIFTKGYGYANTKTGKKMQPHMRIPIGSTTKALISGPVIWQLIKADPKISRNTPLYGSDGVFKNTFQGSIHTGRHRHQPIVALAINPENQVYTWYSNGTVSKGSTKDLDRISKPKQYSLPPNKKPVDIRAIAISKNNRVHVWYDDKSHSVGTSTDLDKFQPVSVCKTEDKSGCISLPAGKSILHIVGMAIAKSNNHVYAWYEDGTVSSGNTRDLARHFGPRPFTVSSGSAGTSYNIRGIAISKSDRVYAWFANKHVSAGSITQLNKYRQPYPYSMASFGPFRNGDPKDWRKWYKKITIQHLLNHSAGFSKADTKAAASLFKTTPEKVGYEKIHKHFLMTRKLLFEPGTRSKYSNHSFGLATIVVPAISGKTYKSYVQNEYLKPLGLKSKIEPITKKLGASDASGHVYNSRGNPVPTSFKDSTKGLAAGGFKSSAQDLTQLMVALEKKYSWNEIDSMGWGSDNRNRLEHSGLTTGGTAYVAMFPKGYTSLSGRDLSNLKIAVIANIWTDKAELKKLANIIAVEVADTPVPKSFNIWND